MISFTEGALYKDAGGKTWRFNKVLDSGLLSFHVITESGEYHERAEREEAEKKLKEIR